MTTSIMLRTQDPASIPVLRSARRAFCGKSFRADDSVDGYAVDRPRPGLLWTPGVVTALDVPSMLAALQPVARMGDCIIIRGRLVADPPPEGVYRRMVGGGFSDGVWAPQERYWVALDLDGVEVDDAEPWRAISELLPEPFTGASFAWNLTASFGLKPGVRARLFFWLSQPVSDAQLRSWAASAPEALHLDTSLFNAVQPHYIADPRFEGVEDPAAGRGRWGLFSGRPVVDAAPLLALPPAGQDDAHVGFTLSGLPTLAEGELEQRLERIRRQSTKGARHNHMVAAACEMIGMGLAPELAEGELEDLIRRQGREPDPGEALRAIKHAVGKLKEGRLTLKQAPVANVLDAADTPTAPDAPPVHPAVSGGDIIAEAPKQRTPLYGPNDMLNAGLYKTQKYPNGGFLRWAEQDWEWTGAYWRRLENDEVLVQRIQKDTGMKITRARATAASFRSLCSSERLQPPCTMSGEPLGHLLVFRNGVLDLDAWLLDPHTPLLPHDPNRFVTTGLPYDYDPSATCRRLPSFIHSLWPTQEDQRIEYQKMLGYMLLPANPLHKLFILMGSPRSGKGTTLRLIRGLVGADNCCAPNLSSLSNDFGLDPLVGRSVALIGEMNQQARPPESAIDRIKAISGGDQVPVNRKGKGELHLELPTRLVICCNRLPGFLDPSGALADRMVLFTLWNTHTGREDRNLDADLANELPGIANFALAGLRRLLVDDGDFIQAKSAARVAEEYRDMQSPSRAFLTQCVRPAPNGMLSRRQLYSVYCAWAAENGHKPMSVAKLLLELAARWPHEWEHSEVRKLGSRGDRFIVHTGFELTENAQSYAAANALPGEDGDAL